MLKNMATMKQWQWLIVWGSPPPPFFFFAALDERHQAAVEELPANRCSMNMAALITQIKVSSGGLRARAAAASRRHGPDSGL